MIVILTILATIIVFFVIGRRDVSLISPVVKQDKTQLSSPIPSTSYNPPKEVKYGSSTDLQKELETVSPQILDSDFEE